MIGHGYNGVIFKTADGTLYKLAHSIFGTSDEVRNRWTNLYAIPLIATLHVPLYDEIPPDRLINKNAAEKETLGTLMWSIYEPTAVNAFPYKMSRDRLAVSRRFFPGTPLDKLLKAEHDGLPQTFNMKKVWAEVVRLQRIGEQMFFDSGVMADFLNPANFLVAGDLETPHLELIDHELIQPTPEIIEYCASRGIVVPRYDLVHAYKWVDWPLLPEHVVLSKHWDLSYKQALDFIEAYHHTQSSDEAVKKLAQVPEWKITFVDGRHDYTNIRRAKADCDRSLQGKPATLE